MEEEIFWVCMESEHTLRLLSSSVLSSKTGVYLGMQLKE
jgi:hypothetical protein